MEQYINKAAVVAEIERRVKVNKECMLGLRNLDYYQGKVDALNDTISFLDTLEVKEVDLEKESLTWKDIGTIDQLLWDLSGEHNGKLDNEGYYKAVLSKYKAQKG